jgi:hypothetical protein
MNRELVVFHFPPHPVLVRKSGGWDFNICSEAPREEGITDQDKDPEEHNTENQAPGNQLLFNREQRLILLYLYFLCIYHLNSPPSESESPCIPGIHRCFTDQQTPFSSAGATPSVVGYITGGVRPWKNMNDMASPIQRMNTNKQTR